MGQVTQDFLDKIQIKGVSFEVSDIEAEILEEVKSIIEEEGLSDSIDITRVKLYGSRADGINAEDSDLDILVEYNSDDWKEDSLFNLLHEEDRTYEGLKVDYNPITPSDSGTIEEYLNQPHVQSYREAKLIEYENNSIRQTIQNNQSMAKKYNQNFNADGRSAEDRALDKFAELMIEKIESIQQDWKKPWFTPGAVQVPKNLSGREYNGMNSIILMMQQEKNGWQANRYATHDRFAALNYSKDKYGITPAKDAEGNKLPQVLVNKGEKSTPVFITVFSVVDPETKEKIKYDDYKQMSEEERAKYNVYPKLQVYNVFNVDQTNLKEARPELYDKLMQEGKGPELNDASKMEKFPAIDAMIEQDVWACPIKPTFGDDAYYSISKDEIVIPKKEQFVDGEAFYSNLLHEMAHSTGAESRLDRLKPSSFGSKSYAKEELVAELTAALVSTQNGFSKHVKDDSAAYLKNWLDSLKEEPSFVKNVLMDVKRASSFTNQRIAAVSERLERDGPNADMSDLREKNKSFAPSYSALKPQTSPEQKEQEPAVEDKQTENKEQVARQTASFRR